MLKRKVDESLFSLVALGMAIFKISKNPSGPSVFDLILQQDSREELNRPAFFGFNPFSVFVLSIPDRL